MGGTDNLGAQWDLRPHLNQTPGAQGTLFGGRGGARSWPRGYSPERMTETKRAVAVFGPMRRGPGAPAWDDPAVQERHGRRRRETQETIARSTMPMSDLGGERVQLNVVHDDLLPHRSYLDGAAGVYLGQLGNGTHQVEVTEGPHKEATVLHELGHVVSTVRGSHAYGTPSERGKEEAFADDYADRHFRPAPGERPLNRYEYEPSHGQAPDVTSRVQFSEAYRAHRELPFAQPHDWGEAGRDLDTFEEANSPLPGMSGRDFGRSMWDRPRPPHYVTPWRHEQRLRSAAGRR